MLRTPTHLSKDVGIWDRREGAAMEYDYGWVQYEYKMVQMPQTVRVTKEHRKEKAAHYLETLANEQAADGWEFHRVDRVGTVTSPGFLARLMGAQSVRVEYCVVTFRRPVLQAAAEPNEAAYGEEAVAMTPEEMADEEAA